MAKVRVLPPAVVSFMPFVICGEYATVPLETTRIKISVHLNYKRDDLT